MATLILEHSDSDFDADDWASVGVPRASLLLMFLPLKPSRSSTCRSCRLTMSRRQVGAQAGASLGIRESTRRLS